jgi:hypothetical protein
MCGVKVTPKQMAESVDIVERQRLLRLGDASFPSREVLGPSLTRFLHLAQPIKDRLLPLRDDIADDSKGGV